MWFLQSRKYLWNVNANGKTPDVYPRITIKYAYTQIQLYPFGKSVYLRIAERELTTYCSKANHIPSSFYEPHIFYDFFFSSFRLTSSSVSHLQTIVERRLWFALVSRQAHRSLHHVQDKICGWQNALRFISSCATLFRIVFGLRLCVAWLRLFWKQKPTQNVCQCLRIVSRLHADWWMFHFNVQSNAESTSKLNPFDCFRPAPFFTVWSACQLRQTTR